jgi:hypothetical protein
MGRVEWPDGVGECTTGVEGGRYISARVGGITLVYPMTVSFP